MVTPWDVMDTVRMTRFNQMPGIHDSGERALCSPSERPPAHRHATGHRTGQEEL